jgi:hypothetical protein
MPESDFSESCINGYGSSPSRYGPSDPTGPTADPETSRFPRKERPYMPGSQTTPGPTGARSSAPADFAFRQVNNVGTRVANDFAAQWLGSTLPYRRFADALADVCAQIGADVDCYSLIAVDFHHILLASLPAHSLTLRPAHAHGHQVATSIQRLQPFRYLHDCSDCFRLERLPGGARTPLESAALSRRAPKTDFKRANEPPRRIRAQKLIMACGTANALPLRFFKVSPSLKRHRAGRLQIDAFFGAGAF